MNEVFAAGQDSEFSWGLGNWSGICHLIAIAPQQQQQQQWQQQQQQQQQVQHQQAAVCQSG